MGTVSLDPIRTRWWPLPWQGKAFETIKAAKTTYARCGLGAGKTALGAAFVAYMTTVQAGSTGLVLAPTYPMLRDASWRSFSDNYWHLVKEHSKSDKIVTTANGSTILWRSASDPDALRGPNIAWVWMDEVALMSEEAYNQALSRMREGKTPKLLLTSTPNAIKGAWLRRLVERTPSIEVVTARTRDNTTLPADYIKTLEETFTADYARQELLGEDIDITGPVMQLSWIRHAPAWVRADGWTVTLGVDLAISASKASDFRANVVTANKGDDYLVVDVTHGRWSFHEHVKEVQRLIAKWKPNAVAVEDVAYQHVMIQELRRIETTPIVSYKPGTKDKLTRFQPWAAKYELGKITHCGTLPEELELELEVFPSTRYHDDLVDALTISLSTHVPRKAEVLFL